jgi:hypothetical protein
MMNNVANPFGIPEKNVTLVLEEGLKRRTLKVHHCRVLSTTTFLGIRSLIIM